MRYDLAAMARRAGHRRNKALRPIVITETLQRELYAIAVRSVRRWQAQVRDSLLPAYARALSTLTQDDEAADLAEALRQAEEQARELSVEMAADIAEWIGRLEEWHRKRWSYIVRAGTGVDVFPFIDVLANDAEIRAFENRIANLIRSIDDTARKDVSETIWRAFVNQTPRRQVGKGLAERLGIARRRANFIAVDQSQKLAAELTRLRQQEAEIDKFKWRHSGKPNYRPHHLARDGKVYSWDSRVAKEDAPGFAPYCACQAQAWVEIEE
jgi:SPP1 gp7 family putative phage head morphogenesis protein